MKKFNFFCHWPSHLGLILGILILTMGLVGCENNNILNDLGDDGSKEARTEEALQALDDGDYSEAIGILQDLTSDYPDDGKLWQYLSTGYSGRAGLDTINLLEVMDELEDNDDSGSIDMIGRVLGDDAGNLTDAQLTSKSADIDLGIDALYNIINPDNNQDILKGLMGIADMALTMARIVSLDQDLDGLTLTEAYFESLYTDPAELDDVVTDDMLADLGEDIANIEDALQALDLISADNDLGDDFEQFQNDFDQNGDGDITVEELETYLNNLGNE